MIPLPFLQVKGSRGATTPRENNPVGGQECHYEGQRGWRSLPNRIGAGRGHCKGCVLEQSTLVRMKACRSASTNVLGGIVVLLCVRSGATQGQSFGKYKAL